MNVLLTCAGRRNYLVAYFRAALGGLGRVLAADASPHAPALAESDQGFVVPPVSDPSYMDVLERICAAHEISLIVPLNDLELPWLARARQRFLSLGIFPLVSAPAVIDACFDKWAMAQFLATAGLRSPLTFLHPSGAAAAITMGKIADSLVVKPRWGSASAFIEDQVSHDRLGAAYDLVKRRVGTRGPPALPADAVPGPAVPDETVVVQERIAGREYGLDVVNDLEGRPAAVFVKEKLSMRGGETDRAITRDDALLREVGLALGSALGHLGVLDVDLIVGADGRPAIIDLNPRFGGGYPFSHAAGADVPAALIAWVLRQPLRPDWLEIAYDLAIAKCDRLVVTSR